jgi:hypothetical protein
MNTSYPLKILKPYKRKSIYNKNYRSRIALRKQIEIDKAKGIIK